MEPELVGLRVQLVPGRAVELRARPRDRIGRLKAELEALEGIPAGEQRFIFAAKTLDDERTVQDYGLHLYRRPVYVVRESGKASKLSRRDRARSCCFSRSAGGRARSAYVSLTLEAA